MLSGTVILPHGDVFLRTKFADLPFSLLNGNMTESVACLCEKCAFSSDISGFWRIILFPLFLALPLPHFLSQVLLPIFECSPLLPSHTNLPDSVPG